MKTIAKGLISKTGAKSTYAEKIRLPKKPENKPNLGKRLPIRRQGLVEKGK